MFELNEKGRGCWYFIPDFGWGWNQNIPYREQIATRFVREHPSLPSMGKSTPHLEGAIRVPTSPLPPELVDGIVTPSLAVAGLLCSLGCDNPREAERRKVRKDSNNLKLTVEHEVKRP